MSYRWIILLLLLGIALGIIGASLYFSSKLTELELNPQNIAQDNAEALVARVSTLFVLPEDEMPTIATVSDPKLLGDQPFFAEAKEGYKILIYAKAQKAILYDPINHKIVAVAPLNIGGDSLIPLSPE